MSVNLNPQLGTEQRKRINSRHKGRRGEQDVATLLREWINEVYEELGIPLTDAPKIERNLMQVGGTHRSKGQHDLIGLDWLAIEVKRVENESGYNLTSWWEQAKGQALAQQEPILFWRLNGKQWNVKMFAYLEVGHIKIKVPVVITSPIFAVWFKQKLRFEIVSKNQNIAN